MQARESNGFGTKPAGDWIVDLATGRVVREPARVVALAPRGTYWLARTPEANEMSSDKPSGSGLNPIDDIKGAVKFVKELDPIQEVKDFMETAAKLLEPAEADLRVIEPEMESATEQAEPGARGREPRPPGANPQPDAKALNKEHRGY